MSLETDLIVDRRRIKRRLVFWRSLAVLAIVIAALVGFRGTRVSIGGSHLARLSISGIITDDRKLVEAVSDLADNAQVTGLIVSINSPGGSVSGGESMHDAIARVAAKKPVVAVMGGLAASAGYMVALPAERIFARESTLTGSIGVILETGEVSGLLNKIGVTAEAITSGPLKDQPNPAHPLSAQGREVLRGLVMDMYEQFVSMVATGRHLDPEKVRQLGDGRAYTGHQALPLGLIDAIGGEREAREWLATAKGIPTSTSIEDVTTAGFASRALADSLAPLYDGFWKVLISQSLRLDGAQAIWQRPQE
jgi:protease-4